MVRRIAVFASCLALTLISLVAAGPRADAAPGDPFPPGVGLVFVAQGQAIGTPTTLYTAEQSAGEITFVREGTAAIGYNAMGFHEASGYLYGINNNDGLVRIGQGGVTQGFGQVGLPASDANYNQGTFGQGATSDTLYVRRAANDRNLYAIDVVNRTSRRIDLSAAVPNVSDITWADGYLWGVYGEGNRLYRIDPSTGDVLSVPTPALPKNPHGAQWLYGNGNLGISNNVTGTVYQLQLNDPASDNPSLTIVSSTKGPANSQNDGASYLGENVDLGIVKDGPATWEPGETLTYTLTVHNHGPGDSSGYIVTDDLPAALVDPATTTPGCEISGTGADAIITCTGPALPAGQDGPPITITGQAPATAGTDCATDGITNTARVLGNESDPTLTNNLNTTTACPQGTAQPSFTVSKTASPSAPDHVKPGDVVTYTVTVVNTGTEAYTADSPASFTDNLANVLDDATIVTDSVTGGGQYRDGTIVWSGPLDVGATQIVTYKVRTNVPGHGDHTLRNALVPGGTGTCAAPGECEVETPVAEFSVSKGAAPASVVGGDVVTYSIKVTNTGAVPFGPGGAAGVVEDSLAGILPHADYNGDASHGGVLDGETLTWELDLPVGGEATFIYTVTVHDDVAPGAVLTNAVTPDDHGSCVSDAACTTDTPVRAFTVAKEADKAKAAPGDTVTYTVTVSNVGGADFTEDDPAAFTDDLSEVLDDADYNDDADGGATVTDTELSWSGALATGKSVRITYSVTVADPARGDGSLTNVVVPDGDGGSCVSEDDCTTTVTVDEPPTPTEPPVSPSGPGTPDTPGDPGLPVTGSSVLPLAGAALLLIAAGLLLARYRLRRR